MMILNYLWGVSFVKNVEIIRGTTPWISTIKRSVSLRQPRLDCTVVMNRTTKGYVWRLTHPSIVIQLRIYYFLITDKIKSQQWWFWTTCEEFLLLKNVEIIRGTTPWFSTMKRSVSLRQPRLDCTVVMNRTTKGFRLASLASRIRPLSFNCEYNYYDSG